MFITLGAIFILLILSGLFSGSETALTAASKPLMHQLEQKGDKRAELVNQLHARKDQLIGAILLGNNLVNIMASALATSILITFFGEAGVAYATIVMTLLVLIFSEVLPKTYAIENANRMALTVAPYIRVAVAVFSPVTNTVQWIVNGVFKLFGINDDDADASAAVEELRGAIDLHDGRNEEAVNQERAMLRSVLDLNEVDVEEIMTHRKAVATIDVDLPTSTVVDEVLASPYTRIPLWRGTPDNVIGVLHAKELLRAIRSHQGELDDLKIEDLATAPWFIPESTSLLDQLQAFRNRHEHFSLVVDEYGVLLGVVTLEDILEEIVGDISDEHDINVEGVQPQPDGSFMVDGTVTLRDLNREFGWQLPDEEAATIAGLILHESRRIPEVGQTFSYYGFRMQIVERLRNQITLIRIMPLGAPPKNEEPHQSPVAEETN